jgi:lipoprotein NlpD
MMRVRGIVPGLAALVLAACGTTTVVREEALPPARPVAPVDRPVPPPSGPTHRVQPGDTLYGIAFRNDLDWRAVAAWNGIDAPYTIRPGEVLRLTPPDAAASPGVASAPAPRPVAVPVPVPPPMPRGPAGAGGPVPAPDPPRPAPAAVVAPIASAPPASPPPSPVTAPTPTPAPTPFRPGQWLWPTDGQVVARFADGDKARQGIAVAGTAGQPVRAAASGTVVYSGAGLVGYGELIIVKHSDEWLSAYGHNRRRLVAEGATVQAGQQIAELGRTGTSRDMLHFEVRRNGRPVDPLPLLPPR